MTPYNIAFLFCRLLSIWCVARFVELFGQVALTAFTFLTVGVAPRKTSSLEVLFYVAWPMGLIVAACILWIGAPLIARSVAQDIVYMNESTDEKPASILWNIGRGLLGIYFVIHAVSMFSAAVFTLVVGGSGAPFQFQYRGSLASAVIELVLGAALVIYSRRALKREVESTSIQDANQTGSL